MPALVACLWGLAMGVACGGAIDGIKSVELKYPYFLIGAFLLQGLTRGRLLVPGGSSWGVLVWATVTFVLILVLALQGGQATLRVVALGMALNLLVVLLNGFMPVFVGPGDDSVGLAGSLAESSGFYALGTPVTMASVLADGLRVRIVSQSYLLSIGDLLLVCGVSGFIVSNMLGLGQSHSRGATQYH